MRPLLTALALIVPAPAADVPALPDAKGKIPAIALLPDGSELKGVMLPRYDENHKLVGVLKSQAMTLVSAGQISGRVVTVEFFNPDQSPRGRLDLVSATFYQEKQLISTEERVEIKSDRLSAKGEGLYYSFAGNKGFLLGHVTTILQASPKQP